MNITYFLGAGASCNALPLSNGFANPEHLPHWIEYLENFSVDSTMPFKITGRNYSEIKDDLINDFKQLFEIAMNHSTIDTYAKMLSLTNKAKELKELKIILSCYLELEQIFNEDKRYENFFASILDVKNYPPEIPPSNIKIVSWNYDFQFEIAYRRFMQKPDWVVDVVQEKLQVFPWAGHRARDQRIDLAKFCVLKLNGTAGSFVEGGKARSTQLPKDFNEQPNLIVGVLNSYEKFQDNNLEPIFYFAWEENEITEKSSTYLKLIAELSDIVVIIGYSFPFFNRRIDKIFFTNLNKFQKIIIQNPEAIKIKETLLRKYNFPEDKVIPYPVKGEFFLPDEFD